MNLEPREGESHVIADERLTSGQAARLLEVSQSYLGRLARLGQISFEVEPSFGYRTFSRAEIEALREQRTAGTAA